MEDIKNKLGEYRYNYFQGLQNYLEKDLHFYGSIKRYDFFENSDIDVIVITDNVNSTLSKLKNYLNVKKTDIVKLVQRLYNKPNKIIIGYKIKYIDESHNLKFDILVYDEEYRDIMIQHIDAINNLPFYMIFVFVILKVIYYDLCMISSKKYYKLKSWLFTSYWSKQIMFNNKQLETTIMLDETLIN